MDRLIKEHLAYLLQENSNSKRLGRRIINLAGFLDSNQASEAIQRQLGSLSRLLILQDAFDALLEPLTLMSRASAGQTLEMHALQTMISSVEEARKTITELEEINYPLLISWLLGAAESRKILRVKKVS